MNREKTIAKIKRIIGDWGSVTTCELELECSPCINSIGNGKNNVSQLIESFNVDDVDTVTYQDEQELGGDSIAYEDLTDDILEEIEGIIETYDVVMNKTMNSTRNNNY